MRSSVVASTVVGWMCLATLSGCDLVGLQRCQDGACPEGSSCNDETGYCEAPGVALVSPLPGHVGASVPIIAELSSKDPSVGPEELVLTARSQQVTLSKGSSNRYTGTWLPSGEGAVSLVVSDPTSQIASDPVSVIVDLTPPTFQFTVPDPQRNEGGGFSDREGISWKRDEQVVVQVRSDDTIDVGSVQYSVQTTTVEGVSGPALAFRSISGDGGTSYFGEVPLDLSEPVFNGFRGKVVMNVSGADLAGNVGSGTTEIPLTRFKWRWSYPVGGAQLEAAISDDGAVWTGVVDGGTGRILRIDPDGTLQEFDAPGLVGGLLIGPHPSNTGDGVYFTANTDGAGHAPDAGFLRVIDTGTREVSNVCGPYASGMHPQLALAYRPSTQGGFSREILAAAREGGGALISARVEGGLNCFVQFTVLNPTPGSSWGVEFESLYLSQGTSTSRWNLVPEGWEEDVGWPAPSTVFLGLAPNGDELFGTGQHQGGSGMFVLPSAGGASRAAFITPAGPAAPAAFDGDWNGYFGDGAGSLLKVARSQQLASAPVDAGTAPVLGEGGRVYAIAGDGHLAALDTELNPLWSLADAGVGAKAMLLDCARRPDGGLEADRPGVLLIPSEDAMMAVIVDSRGLDTDAGWARARHDNRNSASRTTSLVACP